MSYFSNKLPIKGIFISFPASDFEIPDRESKPQTIKTNVQKIVLKKSTKKNKAIISVMSNNKPCLTCFLAKWFKLDLKSGIKHRKGI